MIKFSENISSDKTLAAKKRKFTKCVLLLCIKQTNTCDNIVLQFSLISTFGSIIHAECFKIKFQMGDNGTFRKRRPFRDHMSLISKASSLWTSMVAHFPSTQSLLWGNCDIYYIHMHCTKLLRCAFVGFAIMNEDKVRELMLTCSDPSSPFLPFILLHG